MTHNYSIRNNKVWGRGSRSGGHIFPLMDRPWLKGNERVRGVWASEGTPKKITVNLQNSQTLNLYLLTFNFSDLLTSTLGNNILLIFQSFE